MPIKNPKELERVALKVLLSEDEVEKWRQDSVG
jgi:hypothetical protein